MKSLIWSILAAHIGHRKNAPEVYIGSSVKRSRFRQKKATFEEASTGIPEN